MQRENWIAVVGAIATYDDVVMQAAQKAVPVLLGEDSYDYDFGELRAALAADEENIGRDYRRPCWAHDQFHTAIEQYEDECHWDAARTLVHALLTRSYSWEQSFC